MNKSKRQIIGFAGRKRSGKTTLAKFLEQEYDAVVITIADYLKRLCCELMNMSYGELNEAKDNGYTFDVVPNEKWFNIIHKNTNISAEKIKAELENTHITSIRQLLQVIGTDVIRKHNVNWHVHKMIDEIETYSEDKLIVIDDVRFPNEKDAITRRNGKVFFIIRPSMLDVSNHASETALTWHDFDPQHVIINDNMSLEQFKLHFKVHFANDFDTYIPKSIFLYENKEYLQCPNFGYQAKNDDEFLQDVLRKIKNDKLFKEYGLIRYKTCSLEFAKRYVNEIDKNVKYIDSHCNEFITFNPLIVENLKKYL